MLPLNQCENLLFKLILLLYCRFKRDEQQLKLQPENQQH